MKLFNLNTGYFINNIRYYYNSKPYLGFQLCKGYRIFGIPGYDTLALCCDRESLENELKVLNIKSSDIENYPKDFPLN